MVALADNLVAVGAVTPDSVRIWLRSERPGNHLVRLSPSASGDDGGSASRTYEVLVDTDPSRDNIAVTHCDGLRSNTCYEFSVVRAADGTHSQKCIGEGSFRTPPQPGATTGGRFSIAMLSCHQPFDENGDLRSDSARMLAAANEAMANMNTSAVLMMGDQMYADAPPKRSLFDDAFFASVCLNGESRLLDCTPSVVRKLYQERYRQYWAPDGWRKILANYACYPILDDHEVIDNWGAEAAHDSPEWAAVREGALRAYWDYQGSLIRDVASELPDTFAYEFSHGPVAVMVTDSRTPRSVRQNQFLGSPQLDSIEQFLDKSCESPVVILVTTLPLFHVPELLARLGSQLTSDGDDFTDRLVHPAFRSEYKRLCLMLRDHRRRRPNQRLVLASGDIHVGAISALQWGNEPASHQIISSGITHESGPMSWLSKMAVVASHHDGQQDLSEQPVATLIDDDGAANPYRGLHLGFIELDYSDEQHLEVRLSLYGEREGQATRVLRTDLI